MRDFKKFTSKKIIKTILDYPESRREGCWNDLQKPVGLKKGTAIQVWQNGYHAEVAYSKTFLKEKLNYIHNNPVKDKIVENPKIIFSAR